MEIGGPPSLFGVRCLKPAVTTRSSVQDRRHRCGDGRRHELNNEREDRRKKDHN